MIVNLSLGIALVVLLGDAMPHEAAAIAASPADDVFVDLGRRWFVVLKIYASNLGSDPSSGDRCAEHEKYALGWAIDGDPDPLTSLSAKLDEYVSLFNRIHERVPKEVLTLNKELAECSKRRMV